MLVGQVKFDEHFLGEEVQGWCPAGSEEEEVGGDLFFAF